MRNAVFAIILFSLFSCKKEKEKTGFEKGISKSDSAKEISLEDWTKMMNDKIPKDYVLSNDIQFINDSILKGRFTLDISMYGHEKDREGGDCYPVTQEKKKVLEDYADFGYKNLGDLNGDGKKEAVFILRPLTFCEENRGESYYFTDNKIPRIESDSFCCHLESIFSIGDIDEDGGNEIAEYNSSCTSNYKSFRIWTFKKDKWKLVDTFIYFYSNGKYEVFKDFPKLYKKIGKSKFRFLEISDQLANGDAVMEWKTVTME
jgi:hypothetical protein